MQQPLTQECTIFQCFDRIKYMIPDYQWTCFERNGDLIHVPTKTILSTEIEGYYITSPQYQQPTHAPDAQFQIPIYDLYNEDYVMHTPDPREAVREWFAYVMKRLAQIDLGNP